MKKLTILTFTALIITSFLLMNAFAQQSFSDLSDKHWAYDSIVTLIKNSVVNGFDDSTFRPDDKVTRAQLAKLIATVKKSEDSFDNGVEFADVMKADWYYKYVKECSGLFEGVQRFPDGLYMFYPDANATRMDTAKAVVKALKIDITKADLVVLDNIADVSDLGETDRKYLALAMSNGVILGYPDGTLNPKGELTRAEVCTILKRTFFK